MKGLSLKWQKALVWVSGWASIVAFVLVGGYFWKNSEHEEIKSSAKYSFITYAIFLAIGLIENILRYVFYMVDGPTPAIIGDLSYIVTIVKVVGFAVMFVLDMLCVLPAWDAKAEKKEPEQEEASEE